MDKVCLLITTFNRSAQLNRSLERLCRLTIPDEVIVINDGGQDNCEQTCKAFEGRLPIRYIYNHNPDWSICSMARNIGIKNTNCEIVITSEPEILFITDVVKQFLDYHRDMPNKVISAGTIYHMGEKANLHVDMIGNPLERLKYEAVNISSHGTIPDNLQGYAKIQGWVAPFSALYRREWLIDINGWNEELQGQWGWDDTLLLTRLSYNGIGQEIKNDMEALHQWHSKLPPNIQFQASQSNENFMITRNWNLQNPNNDIKANKNKEWGIIKVR